MVRALRMGCLCAAFLALSACGLGAVETTPDVFVDDVDFDPPGPTARSAPNVTLAANGKATCTWVGDGAVYAERYIPGHGWVPSRQISDDVGAAERPQAATDGDGDAVVVWERDGVIVGAEFEVGDGWQPPVVISDPQEPTAVDAQIAMNEQGDGVVVWEQDGEVVVRPHNAQGWLPPVTLDTAPAVDAGDPEVAIARTGDVVVVWERSDGTIAARRYDESEAQWDAVVGFGSGANPDVGVDDEGDAVVAFEHDGEILVSEYVADVAWVPPAIVPRPVGTDVLPAHTPDVAVAPGGNGVVSFCVGPPEAGEVFVASVTPTGGTDEAVSIAPAVPSCGPPLAAVDDEGNAVVIFQDTNEVVHAVPHDALDAWAEPIAIGEGREPSLAGNGQGDAVTVYVTERGIAGRVLEDLETIPAAVIGVAVAGGGAVTSDPPVLFCAGGLCEQAFAEGVRFELTAAPYAGHRFSHWVGVGGDPTRPTISFVAGSDQAIEAHFVPAP